MAQLSDNRRRDIPIIATYWLLQNARGMKSTAACLLEVLLSVIPTLYESVPETQCSGRVSLLT